MADIGMSQGQISARTNTPKPDKYRFAALSERVHRACVVTGFLNQNNKLRPETPQSNYTAVEYDISDIPRFFDQQVSLSRSTHDHAPVKQ